MSVYDEPKIDCHNHVLDPARFAYDPDTPYRPAGQEIAPADQLLQVMDAYGVTHALVVGPNSGYGTDSRPLLDAIERGQGRLKGVAVVALDISTRDLKQLRSKGIGGIAFNTTLMGTEYYSSCHDLLARLADLGMFAQFQVEKNQLAELSGLIGRASVPIVIDHCGRPDLAEGIGQPGFEALLALGRSGQGIVKLSGLAKFSRQRYPHEDAWPYIRALVDAFGIERCVWGSDWPYLKATERIDYGPVLKLFERLFPDPAERRQLFLESPRTLFGFAGT